MKIKVVSFDMDGTLIRNTNSVRYLCMLNNNSEDLLRIENLESMNKISWEEADHKKANLITGISIKDAEDSFKDSVELIQNIKQVLAYLRQKEIKSVLITSGPIQVANILNTMFGFDSVYGSSYEIKNHKFTGKIISHLGTSNKVECLNEFCSENNILIDHCIAIGDSESDLEIFGKCKKSIAINHSDALKGKASKYMITDDLADIIDVLESWHSE